MELTQNPSVLELVQKTAELTTPKEIVWIDGSEAQRAHQAQRRKAARLLSQPQRRQRRGACRRPDLYLLEDP